VKLPLLLQPNVSIGAGIALLLALVTNRLLTEELLNSQSRADLIAALPAVLLTLKALTDFDITPRDAEAVPLGGAQLEWTKPGLADEQRQTLDWAAGALLDCSPCTSLLVWREGETLLLRGQLPAAAEAPLVPGPLLSKCMAKKNGAPEYLPALQLLPGRVEFSYLPEETQGVLLVPMPGQLGAVVLGTDTQRAFKDDDVAWARAVATRVGEVMACDGTGA